MPIKFPWQFNKNQDATQVKLNFGLGNPISKGIPWKNFSELEIQAILKIHYETFGYNVIWRHMDDPANECGVDLECNRKKDNKIIKIAVKKKPKKEDLGQVVELSQSEADQRIYIYINGAAQSFRNQIPNFEPKVDFWNESKLEENLIASHLTFKLLVDNTYTNYAIQNITNILINTTKKPPNRSFPKPNFNLLMTLWSMKDRAVTLNKCSGMLQQMFEDSGRFGDLNLKQVQNLMIWCLDFLYANSLISLNDGFDSLSNDLKTIFYYTYERTQVRSNWLEIYSYYPRFIPGNLNNLIYQNTPVEDSFSVGIESKNSINDVEVPILKHSLLDEAADEFRCLGIWADGFEGTIDYVFQECLKELKL